MCIQRRECAFSGHAFAHRISPQISLRRGNLA
jgi:hypothetical protein